MTVIHHTWYITLRRLRSLWRQPWFLGITIVQPIIWLVLFGELFRRAIDIPGFAAGSYIEFLTAGVIVMSALFSNGWSGMAYIEDIEYGVLDRFLVAPASRGVLIAGSLAYQALITISQSIIILGLALLMGAGFPGGLSGVTVLFTGTILLGASFASISTAIALIARQRETLIGSVNFIIMPTTFLSSAFMPLHLVPEWMASIARFNPVTWVLEAGRGALAGEADPGLIMSRLALLTLLALFCGWLATRAFRSYQGSI